MFRIKIAKTAADLDQVFELRYRVFVEEEGYFQENHDHRILDRFDAFPDTVNFVSIHEGNIVGSLRLVSETDVGTPADEMYDFKPHLPEGARVVSCGLLCLMREFRNIPQLVSGMFMMGAYWATAQGATHLCAPMNPLVVHKMLRVGFEQVGEQFYHKETGLDAVPMVLDLKKINDVFLSFIENQKLDAHLESFERAFYQEGEYVIRFGERGDQAYVLVNGTANVTVKRRKGDTDEFVIATLEPGALFGELALLTHAERSANVVAATDLDLMVLGREDFEQKILEDPKHAVELLHLVGLRLKDTLSRY